MQVNRVFIDRGHGLSNRKPGAYDPGATSEFGKEHQIVDRLASAVKWHFFKTSGVVDLTPEISIGGVVNFINANRKPGDILLVLHMNASEKASACGVEVVVGYNAPFIRLGEAEALSQRLADLLHLSNRGVKVDVEVPAGMPKDSGKKGLPILRDTKIPAYLLEVGFVTNKEDVKAVKEKGEAALIKIINEIIRGELW